MQDFKILGLIPARKGSKRLPGKNVRLLAGKPMINYTISAAQKSSYIDDVFVSTDCQAISDICTQAGVKVPFMRSADLAMDDSTSHDVAIEVLRKLPSFDVVVLLQPTSPLRSTSDIDRVIKTWIEDPDRACVTVCRRPPNDGARCTDGLVPEGMKLNGAVYVISKEQLLFERTFIPHNTRFLEMPLARSIDIDTMADFRAAEVILEESYRIDSYTNRPTRADQ